MFDVESMTIVVIGLSFATRSLYFGLKVLVLESSLVAVAGLLPMVVVVALGLGVPIDMCLVVVQPVGRTF